MVNICTEMKKRGIEHSRVYSDDKEWAPYRDLYNIIGMHQYGDETPHTRLIVDDIINTFKLVSYCENSDKKEDKELLEELRKSI